MIPMGAAGRFKRVGHRLACDFRLDGSGGAKYEKSHVAIDDATGNSYAEVLQDEKEATTVGFSLRAVDWLIKHGINCCRVQLVNNSAYRSRHWRHYFDPLS